MKRINYSFRVCFSIIAAAALSLSACKNNRDPDEPIARVNGEVITIRDYVKLFETLKPKELALAGREKSEIRNLVIKSLVRRTVILTEARDRKISVNDQELDEWVKKFKTGYTSSSFEENLLEKMVDEADWRSRLKENLLIEKMFESTSPKIEPPSVKDALTYYESHSNLFRKNALARAAQIVVRDKALAIELRKKVIQNPQSFLALAKENSIGPEAQEDAEIKIEKDVLPENLDKFLFEAKIDEVSQVLESPYGFHILKLKDRSPALNQDFEEVKKDILKELSQQKRQVWLLRFEEQLLRAAMVEYNRKAIEVL